LHPDSACALQPDMPAAAADTAYAGMLRDVCAYWTERLAGIRISIPDPDLIDTLKANVAYNLITKDGPGFQPGSRSYDKAWMRDGGVAALACWSGSQMQPRFFAMDGLVPVRLG
jgi:hypothetical protein